MVPEPPRSPGKSLHRGAGGMSFWAMVRETASDPMFWATWTMAILFVLVAVFVIGAGCLTVNFGGGGPAVNFGPQAIPTTVYVPATCPPGEPCILLK